jgi:prepilin-type N-terminal cleavage/methylation domain-containing protein
MNARSKTSSGRRRRRRGVTLIEIVAGLVVLAVLVSAVTIARGRFARQWGDARRKLDATAAVDRLLAGWTGGSEVGEDAIPVPARGALEGVENGSWQTSYIADPAARRLGASVVRLDVFDGRRRLMSIDLLKHIPVRRGPEGGS